MLIKFSDKTIDVSEVDHSEWSLCEPVLVTKYWSGEEAPEGRHFEVRALWTDSHLLVRFVARQCEPLVVSQSPVLDSKTIGLWDRDVCEIFIGTDPADPRRYFEFEVAPTGEWIDLGIHQTSDGRATDWEFKSGLEAHGGIEDGSVRMAVKIPWSSLGVAPSEGSTFKGNLMRCVGGGEDRGYLTWMPTRTATPNFHVPEVFGDLRLVI